MKCSEYSMPSFHLWTTPLLYSASCWSQHVFSTEVLCCDVLPPPHVCFFHVVCAYAAYSFEWLRRVWVYQLLGHTPLSTIIEIVGVYLAQSVKQDAYVTYPMTDPWDELYIYLHFLPIKSTKFYSKFFMDGMGPHRQQVGTKKGPNGPNSQRLQFG